MAGERRYIPASEFCASVRDGTHDSPKPVQNGRKLVTSRHLTTGRLDLTDAYLISEEDFEAINKRSKVDRWDVLISMIGTVGEPCLIKEEPDFAIKNIGLFKTKGEADGKWLYYFLRSKDAQQSIREQSRGTTQQYIPLGALRDFPILVAEDPEEQKAIAAVLGALDDKIELNRRMNATLEAMARALFQSWFVDFDPVRAKLDGRPPAALDPATAALFPASFDETELGHIPKGWAAARVGEVASRIAMGPFGSRITRDNFVPDGVPVVRGGNLTDGFVDNDFVFLTESKADELKASVARSLDIVFTHRGTLGQVGIIPISARYPRYVVSQSQMLLSVDREKLSPWAAYLFFSSTQGEAALLANTSTTGVPAISRPTTSLKAIPLVVPPIDVSKRFDELVQPLFLQREQLAHQSRTLATLRDTLLPKLLSGELSVAELQPAVS
jgi:type I restriction enzyme S subunit